MVLVDDAGGEWPMIGHAPWNGCNLADFVMPFFLFIVGMAITLALKRILEKLVAIRKVILRTLKLPFWGLLLQVAIIEITTRQAQSKGLPMGWFSIFKLYNWQWVIGACVLVVYLATLYRTYVPDWNFVFQNPDSVDFGKTLTATCNVRGNLDPPCNAVGYIDRQILGINHMYPRPTWKRSKACSKNSPYEGPFKDDAPSWCWAPFEPEGILMITRPDFCIGLAWA
ncbi:heparan-alpha-glucosaminide N-acetyltransferase-like [Solanum tuberosum]|uniref:heparan-alpha-glucosaminide N-acetyltransferase-like n=1 Tax=Solanum tuberosum TaxID=4113 RepID=UPI000739F919|nr:PREDICTED: heparan-alpha-glucosaminide N-acetyltransferase-like [Solanum tuberosum]